jgi:hypothetical protein
MFHEPSYVRIERISQKKFVKHIGRIGLPERTLKPYMVCNSENLLRISRIWSEEHLVEFVLLFKSSGSIFVVFAVAKRGHSGPIDKRLECSAWVGGGG